MRWTVEVLRNAALLVLVAVGVSHASAATIPVYRASASVTGLPIASDDSAGDGVASVTRDVLFPTDGKSGSAEGHASGGGLGVAAAAAIPLQTPVTPFPPITNSSGASARVRADDVVISNTLDPGNTAPVSVALSFVLSGSFSLTQNPVDDTRARASVSIEYGFGLSGLGGTAIPSDIGSIVRLRDAGTFTVVNDGIFAGMFGEGMTIDGVFQTPAFVVPVGTPLILSLEMAAGASVATRDGAAVSASSSFADTLAFAPGAVFVLPPGYTANSLQAGIVDNVAAIPEPEVYVTMLVGLVLVGWAGRVRRTGRSR